MLIQCKYCGSNYSDTELECPNCGAANDCVNRTAAGTPKTIDELLKWAGQHHLPLDQMRTYIGQDVRDARAYGIYKDPVSEDFVVYKNKSDGSRAERYRGKDEAYAVNELYQKMKARVAEQKAHQMPNVDSGSTQEPERSTPSGQRRRLLKSVLTVIIFIIIVVFGFEFYVFSLLSDDKLPSVSSGYYRYDSDMYYHDHGDYWYIWNDRSDTWSSYDADPGWSLFEDSDSYYEGSFYEKGYGVSDWDE